MIYDGQTALQDTGSGTLNEGKTFEFALFLLLVSNFSGAKSSLTYLTSTVDSSDSSLLCFLLPDVKAG